MHVWNITRFTSMLFYSINYVSILSLVQRLEYADCTTGDVHLIDGPIRNSGRVEVCINHAWVSVTGYRFHQEEANVVCGELGYLKNG